MALMLKVKWVEQIAHAEPHLRVRRVGGDSGQLHWIHTQAEVIESIEHRRFNYYFENSSKPVMLEVTRTADGTKYLTVATGYSHALFDLPGFPVAAPPGTEVH